MKRELNVTEDDLLKAREQGKDLSVEETREVFQNSSTRLDCHFHANHDSIDDGQSTESS
jgi:hypothetical protein